MKSVDEWMKDYWEDHWTPEKIIAAVQAEARAEHDAKIDDLVSQNDGLTRLLNERDAQLAAVLPVLKRLAMDAETYLHERPVYTGKPIGAEGSSARIEQQRQENAQTELKISINRAYEYLGDR